MKVLVTGATGYIGGAVARALRDDGHAVTGLARKDEDAAQLRQSSFAAVVGDFSNASSLGNAMEAALGGPTGVILSVNKRLRADKTCARLGWAPECTAVLANVEFGSYAGANHG